MKATREFRGLTKMDLSSHLTELRKELLRLNVEVAMGANPASPGKLKQTKKNIARILTLLKEKEVKNK